MLNVLEPFQRFLQRREAGGVVLIICTVIALVWANSGWSDSYVSLWQTNIMIGAEQFGMSKSLHHWINDGLMAVFFLFIGLEIKREVLVGELASLRKAALPIVGAIGGMIVPAAIYAALNYSGPARNGWAIPMATDIAFALGILSLLGKRVPIAVTVFLAALAIADDLGAVIVIAVFYTSQIAWGSLALVGALMLLLALTNWMGVRNLFVYTLLGCIVWIAVIHSGIHASIAGVLVAMTIPARTRIDAGQFREKIRRLMVEFDHTESAIHERERSDEQDEIVHAIEFTCEQAQTPLGRMEHGLNNWVAFGIMPLFALSNAGVVVSGDIITIFGSSITLGVAIGLIAGKTIGITLFAWIAVRMGIAQLPDGVAWRQMNGVAWLGGIGFTMSLFITNLALADAALEMQAKVGILAGSIISGAIGWLVIRRGNALKAKV